MTFQASKFFCLSLILMLSSCAELKRIQKRVLGAQPNSFLKYVQSGMTHSQVEAALEEKSTATFKLNEKRQMFKFEDGAVVEEDGVVVEAFEYPSIDADKTVLDLTNLGMDVVDVMKNAGWPLAIRENRNAHIFYYRTGTLLFKDHEMMNFFNRNLDYAVTVSAYKGSVVNSPVYYLVPSVPGIDINAVEFLEVKEYVKHLLVGSNGKVTEKASEANVILFVNFGVGDKQVDILTYSTPVYRSIYNPGTTTTTQVVNQYGMNIGSFQTSTPSSVTSHYAGQSTSSYKIENYRRHLIMEAVIASEFKKTGERKYFWKTTTESIGPSADFRAILPVLAYATRGYVFKNSGKAVGIRIDFDQMMSYFLEIFSKNS